MAFTVSPTSGAAPYTLSATVSDFVNVNGVDYVASVEGSSGVGSCPAMGVGSPLDPALVESLISGNSVELVIGTIPTGSCRTYTLRITRVSDGVVIASSNVSVNNL